ncbi:hypothetical protein TNCV_1040261 [Trichonephila clavipes]|nr:hypothetical protein TNCV_1040261 [Trichonephila clavipes]
MLSWVKSASVTVKSPTPCLQKLYALGLGHNTRAPLQHTRREGGALPWRERTSEESPGWNGLEESAKERDLVRVERKGRR